MIIPDSGDASVPVLDVYTLANVRVGRVKIFESLDYIEMTGNLSIENISLYKMSEDKLFCELIVTQAANDAYTTTAKGETMIVQGSDLVHADSSSADTGLLGYFKLGYLNEPSTNPNLDLRFSDIVVKTLSAGDDGFPDPPFYTSTNDRLVQATGFTEQEHTASHLSTGFRNVQMTTAYDIIADPTGGGRQFVINAASTTASAQFPAGSNLFLDSHRASVGWWVYLTTLGASGGIMAVINGTEKGALNTSFASLTCQADGAMYITCQGVTRAYGHRRMTLNSWHHFEVEVTTLLPRVEGRWWIDGEEQEPFFEDRGKGRLWGSISNCTVALTKHAARLLDGRHHVPKRTDRSSQVEHHPPGRQRHTRTRHVRSLHRRRWHSQAYLQLERRNLICGSRCNRSGALLH